MKAVSNTPPLQTFFSTSARMKPSSNTNGRRQLPTYIYVVGGVPVVLTGYLYYAYLDEVPLTHRKRWIATTPEWERKLGDEEYQNLLTQFQGNILPNDHRASTTVHRVGKRIADAAQVFAKQHGCLPEHIPTPTTYTVVRSDMANAFVLPNNHIFVMTGLFQYIQDEDDLAAVLGHEMAHNLARHVGEKVSGRFVMSVLAQLSLLIDSSGVLLTMLFLPASNLLRELPHSRTQESEADQIGIYLAAEACYDPRAAKRVFQAMKTTASSSQQPPEFLSTHPSHDSRIDQLNQWLPDALKTFRRDTGECQRLRQEMQEARHMAALQASQREQQQQQQPPKY